MLFFALQKRKRAVSLKAYVGFDNQAFDFYEGTNSLWEVTKVSKTPDPYAITPTTSPKNTNNNNNPYNSNYNMDGATNTTKSHYNGDYNSPGKPRQMQQLTVENLQQLDRRTVPVRFGTEAMEAITEETSSWSQESFII